MRKLMQRLAGTSLVVGACWLATSLPTGPDTVFADDAAPATAPAAVEATAPAETATSEVPATSLPEDEYYELMKVLVDSFEQIDRNYVKEVDRRELVEAAIRGMLTKLDPYTDYISPDDLAKFTEAVEQEFGGVGIQVNFDREHRNIEVMTPFAGSPAYKAGIRSGDRIVEIEGRAVKDFPEGREIEEAVKLLKGEPGVEVSVGVRHPDKEEVQTVKMTREIIQLDTVLGDVHLADGTWNFMLDDEKKIGYLRITHFTRRTSTELRQALRTLREQGMKGLVIDLRFNPGGLLQSAVEVCDLFIDKGLIVSTEGRNVPKQTWSAKPFGTYKDFPMTILINRYSASASEIVSACLQDHGRAIVVGERSWGKGSVQNVVEMEEGKSALKLTTAAYHRPSGKNIHRFPKAKDTDEWGVVPDEGFMLRFTDTELIDSQRARQGRDVIGGKAPETTFVDKQLQLAVETLSKEIASPGSAKAGPMGEKKPEADNPSETEKKAAAMEATNAGDLHAQRGEGSAVRSPSIRSQIGDPAAAMRLVPSVKFPFPHVG